MGGVYTSPYGISVNSGSPTLLICDDFTTDVSLGQTWTARRTTLDALQAEPIRWERRSLRMSGSMRRLRLAAQLMALPSYASEAAGELSYALWNIFDPGLLGPPQHNPYGSLTNTQLNAALAYYNPAAAMIASITTNGVVDLSRLVFNGQLIKMTIYTPQPLSGSQEFVQVSLVSMAEPGFMATSRLICWPVWGCSSFSAGAWPASWVRLLRWSRARRESAPAAEFI